MFHKMTSGSPNAQFGWAMALNSSHNAMRRPTEREERTKLSAVEKQARKFGRPGGGAVRRAVFRRAVQLRDGQKREGGRSNFF